VASALDTLKDPEHHPPAISSGKPRARSPGPGGCPRASPGKNSPAALLILWNAQKKNGPLRTEENVSSSVLNVTFDCSDAASVAQFWSEVTRWPCSKQQMPGNTFWVVGAPGGAGPRLVFVNVPEPKTVKNRVHLDLVPDGSQAEELARLESLGAAVIDDRRRVTPGGWVVMADPEGNEFDLEGGE
jgi:predicted enzyme related to lactoylglutathione lyase